tara:strand:- start:193 stop:390 length:198 start_codon:yes stop_codon:yes gene_type:complete
MEVRVPYTLIMQDDSTGNVHSMLMDAPIDTNYARRMAIKAMLPGHSLVAMVKGIHPIIPGVPTPA